MVHNAQERWVATQAMPLNWSMPKCETRSGTTSTKWIRTSLKASGGGSHLVSHALLHGNASAPTVPFACCAFINMTLKLRQISIPHIQQVIFALSYSMRTMNSRFAESSLSSSRTEHRGLPINDRDDSAWVMHHILDPTPLGVRQSL